LKNIKKLINGFLNRAGSWIFAATIIARISNFLVHLIVLYFIPKDRLGIVIYAYSFIAFLLPISGLGIQQSLVRYGALLQTKAEKQQLFQYVLHKGLKINIFFLLLLIPLSYWYPFKFEQARLYFLLLAFSLLTHFLFLLLKIYFRLFYMNKLYAQSEIIFAFLFLFLTVILSYFLKEIGYIIAIITTPLIVFLIYYFRYISIKWQSILKPNYVNRSFWRYGFFAGLAYVATILLFDIDNILIGNILKDPDKVTIYKYISLIPMSLLFLPRVLMTADFVYITENISDKKYILNYIKTYLLLFTIISILIFVFSVLFGKNLLFFLFGKEFVAFFTTFLTLIFGISGILIFRGLFGNLLSAIGKANLNFFIAIIAIVINIFSNKYFIPKYGILGASITSAILMWFTGVLSCILFFIYYRKMLKKSTFTK
jgi:O-antigen/teichoic acid export membrane protein